jgi:hypothetical protein
MSLRWWCLGCAVLLACGSSGSPRQRFSGGAGDTGDIVGTGSGGTLGSPIDLPDAGNTDDGEEPVPDCAANCHDFPSDPIFDQGVGSADVTGFGSPQNFQPASFCLYEPQLGQGNAPGAMYPANWLRPRFRWEGGPSGAIFEIRLHSDIEASDLVAYTKQGQWLLPKNVWLSVARNVHKPITATIRALAGGQVTGVTGTFQIAPVNAGGTMVYWATTMMAVTKSSSFLVGFHVGDEGVVRALTLDQVKWNNVLHEGGVDLRGMYGGGKPGFLPGEVQCIGCHASTPDQEAVVFGDDWPWDKVVASVKPDTVGQVPPYVTDGGRALLKQPGLGVQTMNAMHWQDGDRKLVTSYFNRPKPFDGSVPYPPSGEKLIWMDLQTSAMIDPNPGSQNGGMAQMVADQRNQAITAAQGTAWDFIGVQGETFPANVLPNWSHDGSKIVYVAASKSENGHLNKEMVVDADVHMVPWNGGKGGTVTPLIGASESGVMEYYPAFSADDSLIAFNRVANPTSPGYYNSNGEIWVVATEGGKASRLAANDPVTCSGEKSPGITNSWAKWSPKVRSAGGKNYYFLIFSSARRYPNPVTLENAKPSQLYVTAIVKDEMTGQLTTYPAVYLWNQANLDNTGMLQPLQSNNLTPAWDEFVIPPVTVIVK